MNQTTKYTEKTVKDRVVDTIVDNVAWDAENQEDIEGVSWKDRVLAFLSYFSWLPFVIVVLLSKGEQKSSFLKLHLNMAFAANILESALGVLEVVQRNGLLPNASEILYIIVLLPSVWLGLTAMHNAINGKDNKVAILSRVRIWK